MSDQNNLADIQTSLEQALRESATSQRAYDEALQKLEPLRMIAENKRNAVQALIGTFQTASGVQPPRIGRGGIPGPRKKYNIDPAKKVEATYKRTMTRSLNAGMGKKEATAKAERMATALKAKLGLK